MFVCVCGTERGEERGERESSPGIMRRTESDTLKRRRDLALGGNGIIRQYMGNYSQCFIASMVSLGAIQAVCSRGRCDWYLSSSCDPQRWGDKKRYLLCRRDGVVL